MRKLTTKWHLNDRYISELKQYAEDKLIGALVKHPLGARKRIRDWNQAPSSIFFFHAFAHGLPLPLWRNFNRVKEALKK